MEESDVAEERARINARPAAELTRDNSLLLVNLHKNFNTLVAVKSACVGVPDMECFGLLGQNGAGKTTIFKMLTGDVRPTSGDAYLQGLSVTTEIGKVGIVNTLCTVT